MTTEREVVTKVRKPRAKRKTDPIKTAVSTADLKITNGYVSLNDYFKVQVGVYKILERNILKGVNSMLLGPTGVKINIA